VPGDEVDHWTVAEVSLTPTTDTPEILNDVELGCVLEEEVEVEPD
jgi:hypothetical protein